MDDIAQQAVSQALSGNWQEAAKLNQAILDTSPEDTGAMVRLAKALIELGQSEKAKKVLVKVLEIDPYNGIATKSLVKLSSFKKQVNTSHSRINPELFLEEPGKTKLVELTHLGDPKVILQFDPGDEVRLIPGTHTVTISSLLGGKNLGRLPDSLGFRVKNLMAEGFLFQALVKSVSQDCLKIFIREVSRPAGAENTIPFPVERSEYEEQPIPDYKDEEDY